MRSRLYALLVVMLMGAGFIFQPLTGGVAAWAQDDIGKHPECPYCGMDRQKFAYSRVLVTYDDGVEMGFCSLRCAAVDLANNIDAAPASIQVGDYHTKALIDAENAHWVIGGNKMGVMSKRAKWAFAAKADAEAFISANGGELATFDTAIKAAYTDLYEDNRMIREKRKIKRMKMQKKNQS